MTPTPPLAGPPELLDRALRADPARPLLTFYDDATDERTELSVTTFANWVAKTANLLQDEFDVGPGSTVAVALPVHWQTAAVLLAAWSCGAAVLDTAAEDDDRLTGEQLRLDAGRAGHVDRAAERLAVGLAHLAVLDERADRLAQLALGGPDRGGGRGRPGLGGDVLGGRAPGAEEERDRGEGEDGAEAHQTILARVPGPTSEVRHRVVRT